MLVAGGATAAHGTPVGIIHHASAAWPPAARLDGSTAGATSTSTALPGGGTGNVAARVSLDRLLQVRMVASLCATHNVRQRAELARLERLCGHTVTSLCTGCQQCCHDAQGWCGAAACGGSVPRGPCGGPLWPPQPAFRAPHQHHGAAASALLLLTSPMAPVLQLVSNST